MVTARYRTAFAIACVLAITIFAIPNQASAQTTAISPNRLNITSSGLADDIQAIMHIPIEEGYTLSGFDVQLLFGSVLLADAYSFTYCDFDQAFIASFDKRTVVDNPALLDVVGEKIRLTVEGQYTAVNADGDFINHPFSFTGDIWIISAAK